MAYAEARVILHRLERSWIEMQPSLRLRALSDTLLMRNSLRAADAFQLAAALRWREHVPRGADFVTYDKRLTTAAASEGFTILPA